MLWTDSILLSLMWLNWKARTLPWWFVHLHVLIKKGVCSPSIWHNKAQVTAMMKMLFFLLHENLLPLLLLSLPVQSPGTASADRHCAVWRYAQTTVSSIECSALILLLSSRILWENGVNASTRPSPMVSSWSFREIHVRVWPLLLV